MTYDETVEQFAKGIQQAKLGETKQAQGENLLFGITPIKEELVQKLQNRGLLENPAELTSSQQFKL